VTQSPARKLQNEHGCIHIARFSNGGVHQRRSRCIDFQRVFTSQPSQHIEKVDRLIAKLPAGNFNVIQRGRLWVTGGNVDHFQFANLAILQGLPNSQMIGVKAAAKANENRQIGFLGLLHHSLDPINIHVNRLLAVDGLTCLNRAAQQLGMGVRGGSYKHRIHIRSPDFLGAGSHLCAQSRRQLLRRLCVDIIDIG
jgi:hypothetical protein